MDNLRLYKNLRNQATAIISKENVKKKVDNSTGWRPINLVNATSKVVEYVLLNQIIQHLQDNNLIGQVHHGSIKKKSTQTLVTEVYRQQLENFEKGEDSTLILLDQSKAFEIVDHEILPRKINALGFRQKSAN